MPASGVARGAALKSESEIHLTCHRSSATLFIDSSSQENSICDYIHGLGTIVTRRTANYIYNRRIDIVLSAVSLALSVTLTVYV